MADLQRLAIARSQIQNQHHIILTTQQQHYLSRVLRLKQGDRFIAIDEGKWWLVTIKVDDHTPFLYGEIIESLAVQTELALSVILLAAMPKGNGFDEVVRQATELGVDVIIPILSDRTLLNPSAQKLERWKRIAQEAAEQSERQIIPKILEYLPFSDALSLASELKYICVTRANCPHLLDCLQETTKLSNQPKSIVVATGPEGGWTDLEVEKAIASGFQPVSLGKRILRAVTAPIVALSIIGAALER